MKLLVLLGLLGFLLAARAGAAQPTETAVDFAGARTFDGVGQRPGFTHLTIEDGLSQNAVHALLQDRRGFIWIGTKDGLNRFDGYSFTVYRHDPFDPTTLSSGYVTALFEDSRGELWVGTQDGGLNRLDRATGRAVRYRHSPRWRISAIAEGDDGALWLGTGGGGAFRLPGAGRPRSDAFFERFVHTDAEPRSLAGNDVTSIAAGPGEVWLGTTTGLSRLRGAGRDFDNFRRGDSASSGREDDVVTALLRAPDGTLWVGSPSGLARLARDGRAHFESYPYPSLGRGYGWGAIHTIAVGPGGRVWLATLDGLVRFDPRTRVYTSFQHDPLDPESPAGNLIRALLWDRTDVLWLGTNGFGVDRYDSKTRRFESLRRPPDPSSRHDGFSVRSLLRDSHGYVWISAGSLYRYDPRARRLISFETSSARPEAFGNTGAWSIIEDRHGRIWFGTYEGLYRYDPATGRVRRFSHTAARAGGLPERIVFGIHEDRNGGIWAVTSHFIGRLDDQQSGRFTVFRHTPEGGTDESDGLFPSVYEDGAGHFWLGTDVGLVRFDPRDGSIRRYRSIAGDRSSLAHDQVLSIAADPGRPDRVLWIGTAGGGLNRLDVETGRFSRVTVREGLPNNVVYAVLPDRRGALWLSTNRGLARYDPDTGAVRTYDARDGLQSNEFNAGAFHRASDGRLYFGGIDGVTSFLPEAMADNPHAPPVAITGFRLAGRTQVPGAAGSALGRDMSATDTLRLSPTQNVFTFEFAALDYSAPGKNSFSYRMEGFDDSWIEAGTERTATYTNLPPGRYTFRVRGANNDGVWNMAGASVTVFIAAPWWRAWWAYAAYALLAVGAMVTLSRYRRNRLELRHRLELERVESEKLRELDRARSRFFANVSHEFRTPLTLTLGPLDDLKAGLHGDLPEAMEEQVDLARRNAGRVLDLINQILDVARLEAGRMPLRAREIDLSSFVEAAVDPFRQAAARKDIRLDVQRPAAPLLVWFDADHVEKVLANLLSNAIKFTPSQGTVRVTVSTQGRSARVEVRDSGPGIPEAERAHVFDRFHRVDESATRAQPGTGIGLALAKELVDLHSGTLTVSSEEGFGSAFVVSLPLGRSHLAPDQLAGEDADNGPVARVPVLADAAGDGLPGPAAVSALDERDDITTVLVVDDHPEVRAYLRRHLAAEYRVSEAANGLDGIAAARATLPDLIVSDVMMPDVDGLELCRTLKADPETGFIPIVLLSARAGSEDRLEGLREHCDDYLTKPFEPAELRARIANLIEQRRRLKQRFTVQAGQRGLHPEPVSQPSTDETFLVRVRGEVEAHLGDDAFSVERLAAGVGVSRAQLHRRLRELLGQAPSDVIRGMRLERAADLLTARVGSVSEVAYAVGFKSVAHFSNAFNARYGCRPSAYPGALKAEPG